MSSLEAASGPGAGLKDKIGQSLHLYPLSAIITIKKIQKREEAPSTTPVWESSPRSAELAKQRLWLEALTF